MTKIFLQAGASGVTGIGLTTGNDALPGGAFGVEPRRIPPDVLTP